MAFHALHARNRACSKVGRVGVVIIACISYVHKVLYMEYLICNTLVLYTIIYTGIELQLVLDSGGV